MGLSSHGATDEPITYFLNKGWIGPWLIMDGVLNSRKLRSTSSQPEHMIITQSKFVLLLPQPNNSPIGDGLSLMAVGRLMSNG
jgi:hypothetical protein